MQKLPFARSLALFVLAAWPAWAAPPAATANGAPAAKANPQSGREINGTCAACHGEYGQGGGKGEYPRIAGQHARYIEDQLRAFRARRRINIPMYPYTQERELPDEDIRDVAAYLSAIVLPTTPPDFKPEDDALTRLLAMEKVMIIPRVEGDLANGRRLYADSCITCHGKAGRGRGEFPMIVGQYTPYLKKQMEAYRRKERAHDNDEPGGSLDAFSDTDLRDILAYLTTLQDAAQ